MIILKTEVASAHFDIATQEKIDQDYVEIKEFVDSLINSPTPIYPDMFDFIELAESFDDPAMTTKEKMFIVAIMTDYMAAFWTSMRIRRCGCATVALSCKTCGKDVTV